jgi:hypothetical protein
MTENSINFSYQIMVEKLKLQISSLEQRLIDKNEMIDEIKNQRDKFDDQLKRLTELLTSTNSSHEIKAPSRDKFLINKATEIIANHEIDNRYEEIALNEIRDENSITNPLSSYTPDSINLDVAVSEFEFYTAENKVPFIQNNLKPSKVTPTAMRDIIAKSNHTAKGSEVIEKHEVDDEIIMANNPFQKTINRIRDSEQKPSETNYLKQTPEFKITDTRGDELDGLINKSASVNSVSSKKTFNKKNDTISTKSKNHP